MILCKEPIEFSFAMYERFPRILYIGMVILHRRKYDNIKYYLIKNDQPAEECYQLCRVYLPSPWTFSS